MEDTFMLSEKSTIERKLELMKYRIGVWSGKGGVGKTTVAINIAALLAQRSAVGLLDADIDCPNVPAMLGMTEKVELQEHRFVPPEKYGMKIVSSSFFQNEDEPIILRGPMKHKMLLKLIELTDWGLLDYMIIDMPPGTSDVPLSAMQFLRLSGIIIVTTPQSVALTDMKRSARMAKNFGVRVLGVVENMSSDVFGTGTTKKAAEELGIPFIGSVALNKEITEDAEKGIPAALEHGKARNEFMKLLDNIKLH